MHAQPQPDGSPTDRPGARAERRSEDGLDADRSTASEVVAALAEQMHASFPLVGSGLGVYFLALMLSHLVQLPAPKELALSAMTGTCGLVLLGGAALSQWRRSDVRWAGPLAILIATVILLEVLGTLLLLPGPVETMSVALYLIGLGLLLWSVPWWTLFVTLAVGGWLWVALAVAPGGRWDVYLYTLMAAVMLSAIILSVRLNHQWRTETERLDRERRAKRMEAAAADARRSERRFRDLFVHSPDAVFVEDLEGRVLDANPAACRLQGIPRPELIGRHVLDLMPPEHREQARQVFAELANGERAHAQGFSQTRDGEAVPVELRTNRITYDGRPALLLHVRDIRERWRAERELRYRVAFESLVARISTTFISLMPESIDRGIDEALEAVGRFCEADRSYLVQLDERNAELTATHEWCAEGVLPRKASMQRLPVQGLPWTMTQHRCRKVVRLNRIDDLPRQAREERFSFQQSSTRSRLTVPMVLGENVIGFLGLDTVRAEHRWSDDEVSLLKIVGEMFANALQRQRSERALRRSEQQHRSLARIRKTLLEELEHRVKNNIAGLLSLVRLYARSARSVPAFAEAIEGKLTAMKTVHEIIASARWQSVDLSELIGNIAHQFRGDSRLSTLPELDGPPLRIVPRQAAPLAMIFQELLTNHLKHGPHTNGEPIRIRWRVLAEDERGLRVRLSWQEPADAAPPEPGQRGVGLGLIEGFARFELGGACRFDFDDAAGLRCELDCHFERTAPAEDAGDTEDTAEPPPAPDEPQR